MDWNTTQLKELFERIMEERNLRYTQRFDSIEKAVATALSAQEKAVSSTFEASEKAITKAEVAQTAYNARSNEFRAALDDQAKNLLPRLEADNRFEELRNLIQAQEKQIVDLQKSESRGEGGSTISAANRSTTQWVIYVAVVVILAALGGLSSLILFLATKH